jgi:hypothetical protein
MMRIQRACAVAWPTAGPVFTHACCGRSMPMMPVCLLPVVFDYFFFVSCCYGRRKCVCPITLCIGLLGAIAFCTRGERHSAAKSAASERRSATRRARWRRRAGRQLGEGAARPMPASTSSEVRGYRAKQPHDKDMNAADAGGMACTGY